MSNALARLMIVLVIFIASIRVTIDGFVSDEPAILAIAIVLFITGCILGTRFVRYEVTKMHEVEARCAPHRWVGLDRVYCNNCGISRKKYESSSQ